MTRTEIRHRRERQRQVQRRKAMAILISIELIISAAPTALVAALVIPLAYAERGYMAMGGEWLMIATVFCAAYTTIHNKFCNKIFGEEE